MLVWSTRLLEECRVCLTQPKSDAVLKRNILPLGCLLRIEDWDIGAVLWPAARAARCLLAAGAEAREEREGKVWGSDGPRSAGAIRASGLRARAQGCKT